MSSPPGLTLSLCRGRKVYEPPRFMSVSQAAGQLLEVVQRRREEGEELGEFTLPTRLGLEEVQTRWVRCCN